MSKTTTISSGSSRPVEPLLRSIGSPPTIGDTALRRGRFGRLSQVAAGDAREQQIELRGWKPGQVLECGRTEDSAARARDRHVSCAAEVQGGEIAGSVFLEAGAGDAVGAVGGVDHTVDAAHGVDLEQRLGQRCVRAVDVIRQIHIAEDVPGIRSWSEKWAALQPGDEGRALPLIRVDGM